MIARIPKKYEVAIACREDDRDTLALILLHSGYSVYESGNDSAICFTATDEDVTEVDNAKS